MSLIGPGTADAAVEKHYGESLAALPLLDPAASTLVDIGSGAGFPGFVLASARAAGRLQVTLVESRERKWSFLKKVALETGISATCLLGVVDRSVPAGFPARVDCVTIRAVKLPVRAWRAIVPRLSEGGRVLVWAGHEEPSIPSIFRVGRSVRLPGSPSNRVLELELARPLEAAVKNPR
jgi:16S rRNA (guanine527-N7)-methyltransferase